MNFADEMLKLDIKLIHSALAIAQRDDITAEDRAQYFKQGQDGVSSVKKSIEAKTSTQELRTKRAWEEYEGSRQTENQLIARALLKVSDDRMQKGLPSIDFGQEYGNTEVDCPGSTYGRGPEEPCPTNAKVAYPAQEQINRIYLLKVKAGKRRCPTCRPIFNERMNAAETTKAEATQKRETEGKTRHEDGEDGQTPLRDLSTLRMAAEAVVESVAAKSAKKK